MTGRCLLLTVMFSCFCIAVAAQSIYTAEGYFRETTKESYKVIREKQQKGDSLSSEQKLYLQDYEVYLLNYYNRLSEEEKSIYERMKPYWERGEKGPEPQSAEQPNDFEWRNRDRFLNAMFGIYYGGALVAILDAREAGIVGIPLITGGLWLLGPAMNARKYEGITQSTIRASNTGKTLGLGYGAALALTLAGEDTGPELALGLSSLGSITLGEVAFQMQKRRKIPDGQIEMMRHYGFLGPIVGASIAGSLETDDPHLLGLSLLGGGVAGLAIGRNFSHRYNYSRGDVDVVNSLAMISGGLGLTLVGNAIDNGAESSGLILIPAAGAIAGTLFAQRAVKNLHLTRRQGSTINLSSTGAALVGLGIMGLAEAESSSAYFGAASISALVVHQILFSKYKNQNLEKRLEGSMSGKSKKYTLTGKLQPENYWVNQTVPTPKVFNPNLPVSQPIVTLTMKFR